MSGIRVQLPHCWLFEGDNEEEDGEKRVNKSMENNDYEDNEDNEDNDDDDDKGHHRRSKRKKQ